MCDGPLDGLIHEDSSFCDSYNEKNDANHNGSNDNKTDVVKSIDISSHLYEAVALDCSFAKNNRNITSQSGDRNNENSDINEGKEDYVLLILAGLTGGSSEGYVLDLVHTANNKGED